MFRKLLDEGRAGDNIGALLRGTKREDIERGQVLAKPGSITPHKKFKGEVYILKKEEGGRHTPFFKGYRPQFYFRTTDVTGLVTLPEGAEMVMPGDNVSLEIELITPIACEEGLRFAIREGGKTVGAGVVTKILGVARVTRVHGRTTSHHHPRMHRSVGSATTPRRRTSAPTPRSWSCPSSARAAASTRITRKRSRVTVRTANF